MSGPIANGTVLPGVLDAAKPASLKYDRVVVGASGELDFDMGRLMSLFAGRVVRIEVVDLGPSETESKTA